MSEYYSLRKLSWSKPTDEVDATNHLGVIPEMIPLCGIHKRHIDCYDGTGFAIENVEENKIHICKLCFKAWSKRELTHAANN